MLRILVAAAVLLAAAYFYLDQGGEDARPLETQQQALEQAKQVEKMVQDQADALKQQIEAQTGDAAEDDPEDDNSQL